MKGRIREREEIGGGGEGRGSLQMYKTNRPFCGGLLGASTFNYFTNSFLLDPFRVVRYASS